VAVKNPVPWDADSHTKAKHALYAQYLSKWMPIMVTGWKADITYAEGFSGPGVYKDGAPGSPVIALRTLVADPKIRTKVRDGGIRFVFVDHDQRCIDILPGELAKAVQPVAYDQLDQHGIRVRVVKGECEPKLEEVLTSEKAWKRPILAVLDTWGGGVSAALVKRFAYPGSEVIITIQPQYFSRFADVADIKHGDAVFGDNDWRDVAKQPAAGKQRWLMRQYRETVRKAGFSHVLDFELVDTRGASLYLVFGTTHDRGLQKMKEAMWEVDPIAGMGYRDPRDPEQEMLDIEVEPQTAALERLIVEHVKAHPSGRVPIYELRRFALYRTVFKESQAMTAVRSLVNSGGLVRQDGVPNDAGLSFQHVVRVPG
jgi:three-Cys-motif partner protein